MKKISRMPHEQSIPEDSGIGPEHDGLPATDGQDVEGHKIGRTDRFLPGLPGTGGDNLLRHLTDEGDDVEGHSYGHTQGENLSPGLPGTGGDRLVRH